jgi:hypothetical protein
MALPIRNPRVCPSKPLVKHKSLDFAAVVIISAGYAVKCNHVVRQSFPVVIVRDYVCTHSPCVIGYQHQSLVIIRLTPNRKQSSVSGKVNCAVVSAGTVGSEPIPATVIVRIPSYKAMPRQTDIARFAYGYIPRAPSCMAVGDISDTGGIAVI